ncbi:cystathionine beta-lyase [Sphingorhabdus lutea]|uniref:Cystathionine beta-lyase n=1 Tax=Sphingorhabdus lutea TaxID=1913578 RepID=A0A1L3J8Y8_9SPHN|nr:cystathionine beta-lyase [Sphingorhabdus lutea]APG61599.1 cystathionine beta-lyase [Sphingorhabdus lutea]
MAHEVDGKKTDQNAPNMATKITHGGRRPEWTGAVVNPPVWRASTHLYENVAAQKSGVKSDSDTKFFYGRRGSPTQWALSDALTDMEAGAHGTLLFPSGVAAISCALMALLNPGDVLMMSDNAYDPSRAFANGTLKRMGIETRFYKPMDTQDVIAQMCGKTRVILLESPGSLTFEVQDVPAICAAAKERGIATILDNSWATSYFFPAIEKGVDISMLAGTKYIVGHSDVMMGSLTSTEKYWKKLRQTAREFGQIFSPDDAYLALRGLRTMAVRLDQHEKSALKIATWLEQQSRVIKVLHPALASCPGHEIWQRDFKGSSGLFSFILDGNEEQAEAFVDALSLFGIGYSWGGFESLALLTHPEKHRSATHWPKNGEAEQSGAVIRLHIGLEDIDDLIADLANAFKNMP